MNAWLLRLSRPHRVLGTWRWRWGKWDIRVTYDVVTACARLWLHRHELRGVRYVALWPIWTYDVCWDREIRMVILFPFVMASDTVTVRACPQ